MSEKAVTEKASKKEQGGKEQNGKVEVVKRQEIKRVAKTPWTLERCVKYARRYANEGVWASASPASYKSAVAHGWRDQCLAAMTAGGTVVKANFKKPSGGSHKKAA